MTAFDPASLSDATGRQCLRGLFDAALQAVDPRELEVFRMLICQGMSYREAACALGTWAHLVFACVPAFHAAWLAVRAVREGDAAGRRRAWAGLAAVAAAGALTLAEYAPILGQMLRIRDEFRALDGNEPTLLSAEGAWMAMSLGGSWCWWASLVALPLVAAGIAAAARDAAREPNTHRKGFRHEHQALRRRRRRHRCPDGAHRMQRRPQG